MTYKITFLGDFYSREDLLAQRPFTGTIGWTLTGLLEDADISARECYFTNVFNLHPEGGDVKNFCVGRKETTLDLPALAPSKYLSERYMGEIRRVRDDIATADANIIVCLGSIALWAMAGIGAISKNRGTILSSNDGRKLLPTYHPRYINQDYSVRPIVVMDLMKAKRQSEFPEIRRPSRTILTEPTLDDLNLFYAECAAAETLSFDIETAAERITCIGFAPSAFRSMVIPFWDSRRGGNYWQSHSDELQAWGVVRKILALPNKKIAQNGLYDIHWLWKKYGIPTINFTDDTMLLHHALQPEFQKGLGFLGSIYTDEPAWKLMKPKGGNKKALKKEDV